MPLLTACEPERGIRAQSDFAFKADVECVERALKSGFDEVSRYDYVDGEYGTFPAGAAVAQFTYYRSKGGEGASRIEVGSLERGTRVAHSFTGIGAEIPQAEFPGALAKMWQANRLLASKCNIHLENAKLKDIGQSVDILHN